MHLKTVNCNRKNWRFTSANFTQGIRVLNPLVHYSGYSCLYSISGFSRTFCKTVNNLRILITDYLLFINGERAQVETVQLAKPVQLV